MGDRPPEIVRRVRAFLAGPDAPPAGSHVLVAVSGGPDSTALAAALGEEAASRGLRLTLAHVRHGLRPRADEDADEAHVRALAERLALDVRVRSVDLASGANVEARARAARRQALRSLAGEVGATHVALAHTRDDQAETLLLRLLRGGGRGALAGMAVRRGRVIRPLLEATRADVRWYLGERDLGYTVDRTNADLSHARNRVRRLLLPLLASEFNPRAAETIASLAARLRDEERVLARVAAKHAAALRRGERLCRDVAKLPRALGRRVVKRWLADLGVRRSTAVQIERVLALAGARSPGAVGLAGPSRVVREGGDLVWRAGLDPAAEAVHASIAPGGSVTGPRWRLEVSEARAWRSGESAVRCPEAAVVDVEALPGPLAVRGPRPGDRVHVPGVGTRKLQDVLVDRKIPREARASLPVVTAGDRVLWIPGVVRTSTARIGAGTRTVLEIRLVRDGASAA